VYIEKLNNEDDNQSATFRLIDPESNPSSIFFNRSNFRKVFESLGYSSQRIGSVLRVLNVKFPIEHLRVRRGGVSNFSDSVLVEFLRWHGYLVCRDIPVSIEEVIKEFERRGFMVRSMSSNACGREFKFSIN